MLQQQEMNTVSMILIRTDQKSASARHHFGVIARWAIIAKETEIAWKHQKQFSNVILRKGTAMGKRLDMLVWRIICIAAGIVAKWFIDGVPDS